MNTEEQKIQAARNLAQNQDYIELKRHCLDSLGEPSSITGLSDSELARAYMYEMGMRNFFRWIQQVSMNVEEGELSKTLKPFEHYTSND